MKMRNIYLLLALPALLAACTPETPQRVYTLHQTYEDSRISITFEDYSETELAFSITVFQEELDSMYDQFDFSFQGTGIIDDFDVLVNGIETTTRDKTTTLYDVVLRLTTSDMDKFVNVNESCSLAIWGITFDII